MTLVAKSRWPDLKGREVGAVGWSQRGTVQPGGDTQQVDRRGCEDVLEMGLGEPAIAGTA